VYPINNASPEPIAIGAVVQISDGAVQTSGCTVRIKPKGVAEGDGAGTTSYSTDGIVYYTPTQAETNYTSFILIAKKASCIPVSVTVVTSASSTAGTALLAPTTHTSAVIPTVTTLTGHTAQTGDSYAIVSSGTHGNAAIKGFVDDIGVAGAGLTAIPWNAAWDTEVQSEVQDAIEANNLDHLVKIGVETDFATTVHLDSVVGMLADNGTTATYNRATMSLESTSTGVGNNGTSLSTLLTRLTDTRAGYLDNLYSGGVTLESIYNLDSSILSTVQGLNNITAASVWASGTRTLTAGTNIQLPSNGLANVTAWTVNITGSLSGNVGGIAGTITTLDALNTAVPTTLLDLAAGVETGLTLRQAMRLLAAAAAGELSGAATTTITIRNAVADSKDRIVATVDADGNRSAITVDLT
jgi:hypothetical protein